MTSETLTPSTSQAINLAKMTMLNNSLYQLQSCLEQNAVYQIYQGLNTQSHEPIIIYSLSFNLRSHPEFNHWKKQFFYYALLFRSCHHPSLPKILDCFEEEGHPYLVYEYYTGISLSELIQKEKGGLNPKQTIKYIKQITQGLVILHQKGLVHQNIQPQNIILNQEKDQVILLNFGFYFYFTPQIQQFYPHILTAGYAPLEQYELQNKITPATDIYSLSATFFYLLTATTPLASPRRNTMPWTQWQTFSPHFPESIRKALLKGLSINIEQRCQNLDQWFAIITNSGLNHNLMSNSMLSTETSTQNSSAKTIGNTEIKTIRFTNFNATLLQNNEETLPIDPLIQLSETTTSQTSISSSTSGSVAHIQNLQPHHLLKNELSSAIPHNSNQNTVKTVGVASGQVKPSVTSAPKSPQSKTQPILKKKITKVKSPHYYELKELFKFMLLTGAIAASGGFGFACSLMINRPTEAGATILHSDQSFPPRQNWPILTNPPLN